jgi:hypothetical protein
MPYLSLNFTFKINLQAPPSLGLNPFFLLCENPDLAGLRRKNLPIFLSRKQMNSVVSGHA